MESWKYTAFISYRHGGVDEFVAKTLHTMLENYRVPGKLASKLGKKKIGRIFRDVDELPSSGSLYNNIEEALEQSEFLIVICTPRLQESKWCMREIELFKKKRGSDHIIAVLAEGEPEDSFPYEITHRLVSGEEIEMEPLAADVRGETTAKQKKKMKIEKLRILAAMLAMEGLPEKLGNSRPFEGAAMASLTNALQTYDYQKGYTVKENVPSQTMDSVMVSPDDDYIAYIDLVSSTEYTLHFYDIENGKTVADFPVNPDYSTYRSCSYKMTFFGDHRCAIAGENGIQVIDLHTMKVLWEGAPGIAVSASRDGSVVSVFDLDEKKLTFYTGDGEELSEESWDCETAVYFGISDDGTYAAFTELGEDETATALKIVDTHTGKATAFKENIKYANLFSGDGSWCGDKLLFRDINKKYGYIDMSGDGKIHMTDEDMDVEICYADPLKELAYYKDGSTLNCISITTGKIVKSYECGKNISDAVHTGDLDKDIFAVYCEDGTMECVDFTDEPYRIGKLTGDGTSCSELSAGKKYAAACLYNNYEFRIYQLNDRTSSKKGNLNREPDEQMVTVVRSGEEICVNGTANSYAINMKTLKNAQFDKMSSYMEILNENVLSCDNLDGTISFFDAQTGKLIRKLPDTVGENQEADGAYVVEDGMLKKYDYSRTDKSPEEAEPVYTEKVPEEYSKVYISPKNYLVGIKKEEGSPDVLSILDPDRKQIFSQKIADFYGTAEKDYILYQPEGSKEYVLYNYVEEKEVTRMDLGEFSWLDYVNGGYLFLCSSDKGACILDETTGEIILKIPDASTLYVFEAPEDQPYFTALYLSDNGETRLDVYEKTQLSSPVARIKGGLGMNSEGEVLIYDGVKMVYAVPFLSMDEQYKAGEEFLGDQTLTQEQKMQYHCE